MYNDSFSQQVKYNNEYLRSLRLASYRSVLVFVHGDLTWDRLHLMISRSTTPELIKMLHKLEEFFTQQRTSSKRALSAFGPMSSASKAKVKQKDEGTVRNRLLYKFHGVCLVRLCFAQWLNKSLF